MLTENSYCAWSFGDTSITTRIRFDDMKIIVSASIASLSRAMQTYNTRVWRIALENDIPRRAKLLVLEEQRALKNAEKEIKEGAKSF